jgi:hypothetical protein
VNDAEGDKIKQWVAAAEAHCEGTQPYCSAALPTDGSTPPYIYKGDALNEPLVASVGRWWVRSQDGVSTAWSEGTTFSVATVPPNSIGSAQLIDNSVTASHVAFNYAASGVEGGSATDLTCAGCISSTEVDFEFATLGDNTFTGTQTVVGDVSVTGNLAAKYQDVAEWVDVNEPTAPGSVVVADPAGRNRVKVSAEAYDTGVLGAVSRQPGLVLGESGPNKAMVAQSGRVMVNVDATYGAIAVGDLLTTSPTPGHAMRSEPLNLNGMLLHRPGTVLGKALEPLAAGRAEILVLITLQ